MSVPIERSNNDFNGERVKFPEMPPEGLFGPKSLAWKINREHVTLLGGPAAAVLQIAHPKVARGVADYSDFRKDSYGRFKRTLMAVRTISFGTRREVLHVAENIRKMHFRVRSSQSEVGERYRALDEDLLLWVLTTLVTGAIFSYERFVGALSLEEKNAYLQDMRVWGECFGLSRCYGPQGWDEFEAYYFSMINGPILGGDPICAEVAQKVVFPERPLLFRVVARPLSYLVTEIVPPPVLKRLGLRSTFLGRLKWCFTKATVPFLYSMFPEAWRFPSEYRRSCKIWSEG